MGRKKKPASAVHKDAFNRISFLYQAASITLSANPRNTGLSRFYASTMKSLAQKQVLRLDPSIKRTVCKFCHSLLVPGVTSTVRTRAKRESHVIVTCLFCKKMKRFLARDKHTPSGQGEKQQTLHQPVTGISEKTSQELVKEEMKAKP